MKSIMKISISIDTRPGKGPAQGSETDIAKLLSGNKFSEVNILRTYGGGRHVSVEAPQSLYNSIKSALGEGFVVAPQFTLQPLKTRADQNSRQRAFGR